MRRLLVFVIPLILLTILFLFIVLIINKDSGKGALQVTSSPGDLRVYLNGTYLGKTPLCKCQTPDMIKNGRYTIKLVSDDPSVGSYEDQIKISSSVLTVVDRTFEGGGKTSGSVITLEPLENKKDAQLLVISFPSNVNALLDNNDQGETPLLLKNLTPSDHEVRLVKPGFKDKVLKIRTVLGYKLEAIVTLSLGTTGSATSPTPSASIAATPPPVKILILTTPTGFLRVRQEASVGSAQVGTVNPGESFELVSEVTGWYQIKLLNGVNGWVSSDFAKKQ